MRTAESKVRKKPPKCYNCGQLGHFKVNCPKSGGDQKKGGNSSRADGAGSAKAKAAQSDARGVAFAVGDGSTSSWVIDSGASAHMTNDRSFFGSLREFVGGNITLADGKKTEIRGEGSGIVHGIDGEGRKVKTDVEEVKYVPGLSTNLISVGKLAVKDYSVVFDKEGCAIVSDKSVVIATGRRHGGLYYLRQAEEESMVAAERRHSVDCQHQWHRRLGHRDWAAAERLVKEELATGMKVTDCGLKLVCECCLEGKSARLPFPPVIDRKSAKVLDIVHTDLCGPMNTVTPSGNRYVMTMIDDYSRFTVTYLLSQKSEAESRIKEYVRWVENLFGRKPRVVRSEGGGEYNNRELRAFYKAEGIQPQMCPHI